MLDKAYAVIMAGGKGERFWPLSTSQHPKQVLSLLGNESMLAMAIKRIEDLIPPERVLVITSADLVEPTCQAAPELPRENVIGEPFGRDTAAVCALASAIVKARGGDAFCILTADHVIKDLDTFRAVLSEGFELAAAEDVLITIGIKPSFPSTGYGYIEHELRSHRDSGTVEFLMARRFVEKPNHEKAEHFVDAGNYCWNSGMFIWSIESIQKALGQHAPGLLEMAHAMEKTLDTPDFDATLASEYGKLEKISVDYAIMEKASNIVMAKGTFSWDDVGAWPALANHFPADDHGNVIVGSCEGVGSHANLVYSKDHLTALIGVQDLVVVQAEGATLICHKDKAQDVKKMVNHLRDAGHYDELL